MSGIGQSQASGTSGYASMAAKSAFVESSSEEEIAEINDEKNLDNLEFEHNTTAPD